MIFRLNGNVEETLALTPVMREWKSLTSDAVWADTLYPELFVNNPYVDGVISDRIKNDSFLDFNTVNWQSHPRPVSESFAELLLGKNKLHYWRTIMSHSKGDDDVAETIIPKGRVAIIAREMPAGVGAFLNQKGYDVFRLSGKDCQSWGVFRAAVSMASVYVGFDGNDASVVLTTDVPAVVIYSYRNPVYFAPFRRNVPFEAIVPAKEVCDVADFCFMANGLFESGKTYGLKCPKHGFFCKKELAAESIIGTVERILEKA